MDYYIIQIKIYIYISVRGRVCVQSQWSAIWTIEAAITKQKPDLAMFDQSDNKVPFLNDQFLWN